MPLFAHPHSVRNKLAAFFAVYYTSPSFGAPIQHAERQLFFYFIAAEGGCMVTY
jgi:hypothetical protein